MPDEFFDDAPAGNASTEKIAEQIAGAAPAVQEHAVAAAAAKETANNPPPADAKVDDFGTPFDAAKHTGSKLKNGKWREKKSTLGTPRTPAKSSPTSPDAKSVDAANNARAAGSAAAQMLTGSMTMILGGEWQPRLEKDAGFDEQKFLSDSFGAYFAAKNITDIPPGAALSMALLMYFTSRATMPVTRSRLSRIKSWIAIRLTARKIRKEYAKRGVVARVEIKDGVLLIDGKENGKE